jgi:MFS transporter, FHS family, glucose/mannose:H+ symporter
MWIFTGAAFYVLFLLGFMDNLKGPTVPAVLKEFNFNYSQGGTILFCTYIGFLIATLLTGVLGDVAGKNAVLFAAGSCLVVGTLGFTTLRSFWALAGSMLVIGLGLGALDLGGNSITVELHPKDKGRYLNLISVAHGLSSIISPLIAGYFISQAMGWRMGYWIGLILALILLLFSFLGHYPVQKSNSKNGMDFKQVGRQILMPSMRWLYILLMAYVGTEIATVAWLVTYLQEVRGQSVTLSSTFLSLFFVGLMVGRFIGSFVVDRIGYVVSLMIASIGSTICLSMGIFGPPSFVFFLSLSGLFYSIIFPVTTAMASDLHSENVGTVIGLLFAFAGLGGAVVPWLVGFLSDAAGLQVGFGFNVVVWGLILICVIRLRAEQRHQLTQTVP